MARPLTVFSLLRGPLSVPPGGELLQEILLRLGRTRSPSTVRRLAFIHFARLTIIHRLPRLGQPKEDDIGHPLMLFQSVYDGTFGQYIDAFADAIPAKMHAFWGTSYGFPGVDPVTPFKRYIRKNEFRSGHTYVANPDATAAMINSALALRTAHEAFYRSARRYTDSDRFHRQYIAFLTDVQEHL
jgi:hypothetical protein